MLLRLFCSFMFGNGFHVCSWYIFLPVQLCSLAPQMCAHHKQCVESLFATHTNTLVTVCFYLEHRFQCSKNSFDCRATQNSQNDCSCVCVCMCVWCLLLGVAVTVSNFILYCHYFSMSSSLCRRVPCVYASRCFANARWLGSICVSHAVLNIDFKAIYILVIIN